MSKRRARPAPEQAPPSEPALPMRLLPAIAIVALLVAVAAGTGLALDWSAHPPAQGRLASCQTGAQLAPGVYAGPPPMCIETHRKYTATIVTSKGTITVSFLTGSTPKTVNNFVVLASHGYYNGLKFFGARSWVIQSGDPQGNGRGGVGYTLPQEPPRASDQWVPGALGMARFPQGGISGSQFFILRDSWSGGDPSDVYNHFATITRGFDVTTRLDQTDRIVSVKVKQA